MLTVELQLDQLELGRLYFRLCDFDAAITVLDREMGQAVQLQNWEAIGTTLPLLLRILAERLDHAEIDQWRSQIQTMPPEAWTSKLHYAFGIIELYADRTSASQLQFSHAQEKAKDLGELLHARFGQGATLFKLGELTQSHGVFSDLQNSLHQTTLQDLKIASFLMVAHLLMAQNDLPQAMSNLNEAEKLCRVEQNLFMLLNVLYGQAIVHKKAGRLNKSLTCLELVDSLTNRRDLKHLALQVDRNLRELKQAMEKPTFHLQDGDGLVLHHPDKGPLALNRSGIVIELLKLFGSRIGQTIGKEELVRHIWKQDYHPFHHDNKIYVTIKRLRKLIEVDASQPRYLLCVSDGYCLHSDVRFSIEKVGL
jgi:DNA-binding winged helix-turn-helix (wHTH) protein